ncbi:MAG: carboxypeptidase-like regulatory domain-containing protein [Planctomycetaceae bacterium]|jgi:predicted small lipoprotein YifL|nr:carboxypeptidase-like regulatory domain-containing protein [Planctomycetaceae bacterium]
MKKLIYITLFIFVSSIAGCGDKSRPSDLPPLYPCTVTITQDGKAIEEAMVMFEPVDSADVKYSAAAVTGADGNALMKTYGFEGVPVGKYKVVVTKIISEAAEYKLNESTGKEEAINSKRYRLIEPQFTSAKTTPHEIEITGKEKNITKTFDVGKAVKEFIE